MSDKDNFEKGTPYTSDSASANYFNTTSDDVYWHGKLEDEMILEGEAMNYDWKDIRDEKFRVYVFPCGCKVVIDEPLKLYVSESGGHRVFDKEGISHYIPSGWIHLFWEAKEGQANFRF